MTTEPVAIETPDVNGSTDAQSVESVGVAVPGAGKSGRKPPEYYKRTVTEIIDQAAPAAAIVLAENIDANLNGQGKKHPALVAGLKEICMYMVNQAVGKPRQRVESVGLLLTYSDLAKAAARLDKGKKRPILADVFELSNLTPAQEHQDPEIDGDLPASELGDVD